MPEEICNKIILYFAPHLFCVLLLYLVKQAASLTNAHSLLLSVPAHAVSSVILIEDPDE